MTIAVVNLNDHLPELQSVNRTSLIFLYYPTMGSTLHKIQIMDKDQFELNFEIINSTSLNFYSLRSAWNSCEIILQQTIDFDRQDELIIRVTDDFNNGHFIYIELQVMFLQRTIHFPEIVPQTIDGYVTLPENGSSINFGSLSIENQTNSSIVYYQLLNNELFSLKETTNNRTDLELNTLSSTLVSHQTRLIQYQIQIKALSLNQPILSVPLGYQKKFLLPEQLQSSLKVQNIDVHLWSVDREMLDRTLSILINLTPLSTYEQFLLHSLPIIRENLAQAIGVHLRHVHLYSFERKSSSQIELLLAIIRHPSRLRPPRYIHKKLLYNALKNVTNLFERIDHVESIEKILLNQCQSKSCENNGRCTSHLKLNEQEFDYFSSQSYRRLIPKYQWNIKCLCLNHYHGSRCQYRQDYQSPCASNPCSATERCIEESPTLYVCQCIDEPCQVDEILPETTFDCMNVNSPTCRGKKKRNFSFSH